MKCGLLGRKLGHSYSPAIHSYLGDYDYRIIEKEPDELEDFLASGEFRGLNVTMPYKKTVIPYLAELSPIAQKLGAVNTIVRREDGSLWGHNTDYFGFQTMLRSTGLDVAGKKCLVLGSGGASNTVCHVLKEQQARVTVISRTGIDNYDNLDKHRDASVIVNTTPVGMFPAAEGCPVNLDHFPCLEGVLDLIYNPARTVLLMEAEKRGLVTCNGLLMLVAQAKEAAQHFTGAAIPDSKITEIHRILRQQMENIILIGMPGCGKSTVGRLLAEKLCKKFADSDTWVEETSGCSIPDIIATQGEKAFRELETQALDSLGRQSGLVIATGGGCITQERNYLLLRRNGTVIWLTRQLDKLPTQGRPLSQQHSLDTLYAVRTPLYDRFADIVVDNDGSLESTFDLLLGALEVMK